jgi:hypothetical protein
MELDREIESQIERDSQRFSAVKRRKAGSSGGIGDPRMPVAVEASEKVITIGLNQCQP